MESDRRIQFPPLGYFHSPVSSLLEYSGILRLRPDHSQPHPFISFLNAQVAIRITAGVAADNNNESGSSTDSNQRYDIQRAARWIEHILPFSLLLLLVFIRQHLQGFFVTILSTAFLFKSNEIVRKQTAVKGERKMTLLIAYLVVFVLQVMGVYWWYSDTNLYYPLFMVPPKTTPPFWHAIFIILINGIALLVLFHGLSDIHHLFPSVSLFLLLFIQNLFLLDTMVRQALMSMKLMLLIIYKNGKIHTFRRQGQMLTMVEYTLLLYQTLLPSPVWYRFFLNKEYGSLFSSLTTGLYLTFKLSSILEKVQSFFSSLRALSKKDVHYGSYATLEQLNVAGDMCAICQEKMHDPVLLRCKHIFCEDCVSEWFERERTCPLCRALVRPADPRSFGDGSTSLCCQLF